MDKDKEEIELESTPIPEESEGSQEVIRMRLDQMFKDLFTVSNKVVVKLVNGLFHQEYVVQKVKVTFGATEFVTDSSDLGILRADMFYDFLELETDVEIGFHTEFQTRHDGTMVIRMFQYGVKKAVEKWENNKQVLRMPRQLVIFLEKSGKIPEKLETLLIFPNGQEVNYEVEVMKYWEYTEDDLLEQGLYPLIPLQLMKFRQGLQKAYKKRDWPTIGKIADEIRVAMHKLGTSSSKLHENDEINGDDLHKLLIAIDNLTSYLNRAYIKDETLEKEVHEMTRTLYDPAVEKRGIEQGYEKAKLELAISLLDVLEDTTISQKVGLELELVKQLRKEHGKN